MRAQSFSHVGITVADFNRFVQFYWDVFGCPLVGVSNTPPDRVRSFFGVEAPEPRCKIGWSRIRSSRTTTRASRSNQPARNTACTSPGGRSTRQAVQAT